MNDTVNDELYNRLALLIKPLEQKIDNLSVQVSNFDERFDKLEKRQKDNEQRIGKVEDSVAELDTHVQDH